MAEGFVELLQGIVAAPSCHITRLPCLSVADKELLSSVNVPLASEPAIRSLHELLHLQAKKTPQASAFLKKNGESLTYNEWGILMTSFQIISLL